MTDIFQRPLTSKRHARIRGLLELRDDGRVRRQRNAYLLEGLKLIREAVDSSADVTLAVVSPRLQTARDGRQILSLLRARRIEMLPVSDRLMEHVSHTRTPQGAMVVIRRRAAGGVLPAPRRGRPLLLAWRVQDPGNVGALARIADATGATGLAVAGGGADPYHPRAVRAAAGALLRVEPVVLEPQGAALENLAAAGYRLAAAVVGRGCAAPRFPWHDRWAVVVGSEGEGLPEEVLSAARRLVHVPMEAPAESLSVTASSAMLLYEAARQRRERRAQRGRD